MLEISVEDVKRVLELLLEKVQDQDGVLRVDKEGSGLSRKRVRTRSTKNRLT